MDRPGQVVTLEACSCQSTKDDEQVERLTPMGARLACKLVSVFVRLTMIPGKVGVGRSEVGIKTGEQRKGSSGSTAFSLRVTSKEEKTQFLVNDDESTSATGE